MTKRKRSTPKETPAEGGEAEPTVHVRPDMLAGSPDIFAPGKDKPAEESEPAAMSEDAAETSTPATEGPAPIEEAAPAPAAEEPAAPIATSPTTYQPRPPAFVPPAAGPRRAGSSVALGLILAYMNASQDWPAWAFAWPLVAPGGVGLGIWLQGVRTNDAHLLRQGRVLMFVAFLIFMVGFVIFGTIFKISDVDYGWFGKAALPGLLIVVGILLLARSIQRS